MVAKLVGYGDYAFDDKDGKRIEGRKYHCISSENDRVVGDECITFSLRPDNHFYGVPLEVGSELRLSYNRYGKVDSFDLL